MADSQNKPECPDDSSAVAYLIRLQGAELGPVYTLECSVATGLGRASDNPIVVPDEECSRYHAKILKDSSGWRVQDLGSTNGTFVNERKIDRPYLLKTGDRVGIGKFSFVFATDLSNYPQAELNEQLKVGHGFSVLQRRKRATMRPSLESGTFRPGGDPQVAIPKAAYFRVIDGILAVAMSRDPGAFAEAVLMTLLECTNADAGAVLWGTDAQSMATLAERSFSAGTYAPVSAAALEMIQKSQECIIAEDIIGRNRSTALRRHMALVPMFRGAGLTGAIHLYSLDSSRPMSVDDLNLLSSIADSLADAIAERRRQQVLSLEGETLYRQLLQESEVVGSSGALAQVVKKAALIAANDNPVLLVGELGTGKSLIARSIHSNSRFQDGPFLTVSCVAGASERTESDLFGHEAGAFSSAYLSNRGKAELAIGGTLVIDEIANLSVALQTKLLRMLDGRGFERMGSGESIKGCPRLIATSSKALAPLVAAGQFRTDLLERLNQQSLQIPPLRDRPQDIPMLAQHFLRRFAQDAGKTIDGFSPGALLKLGRYHFPCNVRELRIAVERAVLLCKGRTIETDDLALANRDLAAAPATAVSMYRPLPLEQVQADHILRTLRFTGWNVAKSAEILAIDAGRLQELIARHQLRQDGAGN